MLYVGGDGQYFDIDLKQGSPKYKSEVLLLKSTCLTECK
jgi:hypothetical protein